LSTAGRDVEDRDVEDRDAVRVVLLDRGDRILLFLGRTEDGERLWFTPGGGIDAGETVEQALRRELAEEVGAVDVELGPELRHRTHTLLRGIIEEGLPSEPFDSGV
jgi:8-oxo-dGTP pyrophosphatase MutT (NUDIX family)